MNIEQFTGLYETCVVCKQSINFYMSFSIFDSRAAVLYMMEDKYVFKKSFLHHATTTDTIINPKNIRLQSYSESVYDDSADFFIYDKESKHVYFSEDYKDSKNSGVRQFQYGHFEYGFLEGRCSKNCTRFKTDRIHYLDKDSYNASHILISLGKYSMKYFPLKKELNIFDIESKKRYSFAPTTLDLWPFEEYKLETRIVAVSLLK